MALNREPIFVALAARMQSVAGFVTPCSRIFKTFEDVAAEQQPAMFLLVGNEEASGDPRQPTKWKLHARLVVYNRHDATPGVAPATAQNALLTAIEASLEMQPAEAAQLGPFANDGQQPHTTLGGLVNSCRIFGTVEKDEGMFQEQGIMEIPIELTTTA